MKSTFLISLTVVFALNAVSSPLAVAAASVVRSDSPTQCSDWNQSSTFEKASADYMGLASSSSSDFGCLTRASWLAIEDLFRPDKYALYVGRLKAFDETYRKKAVQTPQTVQAFDDFKVLLQLRWLNDSYSSLKDYHSSLVVKSVAAATAATAAVGAMALLVHSRAMNPLRTTASPALIRMVRYLGASVFANTAREAIKNKDDSSDSAAIKLRPPPLDMLGGTGSIYWNYSDLHLMRDIATELAESMTNGMVQVTASILALRFVGAAATAGGYFSTSSLVGMVVGYPLGKLAAYYTEKSITDEYHKRFQAETSAIATELTDPNKTDWQRYNLGADLTKGAISWVATQDLYLQHEVDEQLSKLSSAQVCTRLRQHSLKEQNEQRLQSIRRTPKVVTAADLAQEKEMSLRFDRYFSDSEKAVRTHIYDAVESKKSRLVEVRGSLASQLRLLQSVQKPYLADFVVQYRALIERLDKYITHAPLIDGDIDTLRAQVASLAVGSQEWRNEPWLRRLSEANSCQ